MPLISEADAVLLGATPVDAIYARDQRVWPTGPVYPTDTAFTMLIDEVTITKNVPSIEADKWTFATDSEEFRYYDLAQSAYLDLVPWYPANYWTGDEGVIAGEARTDTGSAYATAISVDNYIPTDLASCTLTVKATLAHIAPEIASVTLMLELGPGSGTPVGFTQVGESHVAACVGSIYASSDPTGLILIQIGAYY